MNKILLAEDDPASRELLTDFLTMWGYEVLVACDGNEALHKIQQLAPDLAILDIQMPLQDGFSVLRSVRQDQRLQHVRVLALTAFAMQSDREKALAAGFDGFQTKPINSKLLKADIERLLEIER